METPDLSVVDHAFGVFADLYSDILRVSVAATHEQIQLAYFDRRSELFTLLAKLDTEPNPTDNSTEQKLGAERKMDAVVLAVRVLGDADTRLWYDQQRQERLMNRRRAAHGQLPGHSSQPDKTTRAGGTSLDSVAPLEEQQQQEAKKDSTFSARRKKSRSVQLQKTPPQHHKKSKKTTSAKEQQRSRSSSRDKRQKQQQDSSSDAKKKNHPIAGIRSKDTVDTDTHMTDDDDSGRPHGTRTTKMTSTTTTKRATMALEEEQRQDKEDTLDAASEGASFGTDLGECASLVPSKSEASKRGEMKNGMLSVITNSRILRNISEELSGACEDALTSVDQVFNAFTLTDKDISAVLKRIDRAKKQFDH
jgi:curved DNA-binding protein CbpA